MGGKAPQAPTPLPTGPAPGTTPYTPGAPSSFAPGVNLTATNPSNDLRGQTITPGPTADRNAIAQTYETNWNNQTAPQFNADLKGATSQAAGAGQLGSGQLRTSLGNLAYNRDVNRNAQEGNFMNSALEGSIGDAYKNVGIAQQQQGFQSDLQNRGFQQGIQALQAGNSDNPADTQLALSSLYGNQAQGGQQAVSGAINNANNQNYQQQILNMIGKGSPTTQQSPVGTPLYNTPTSYGG